MTQSQENEFGEFQVEKMPEIPKFFQQSGFVTFLFKGWIADIL